MKKPVFIYLAIFLVFLGILALIIMLAQRGSQTSKESAVIQALASPTTIPYEQIQDNEYLKKINQLIELPLGQNPQFGVINDIESLKKQQPFLAKGRNGNILVMYPTMTIIYDPTINTIVDISGVSLIK